MSEYEEFKHPDMTKHECVQVKPLLDLSLLINKVDDRLAAHGMQLLDFKSVLDKLADGLSRINILGERDLRREKDIENLGKIIRDSKKEFDTEIDSIKKDISNHSILIERVTVKMAVVAALAMFAGTILGGIIVKSFGS